MYHISLCKYANALTAMYIKNLYRISVLYRIRGEEKTTTSAAAQQKKKK